MAVPFVSGAGTRTGMQVKVILDHSALNKMLSGRTGDLANVKRGFASRATRNARQIALSRFDMGGPYAHRRTGRYVRSISSSFPRGDELRIEANVPYAVAIELGTGRHPIFAGPRNLLTFYWVKAPGGPAWVKFPVVSHPGNRPYLILTDAVTQTAQEMGF